ncbi:hydroxyethylthiazole kinase [Pasteurellaceae bacterium RH1A]|nr:hydroxyethylthiazole kinase [Pasteurellaceae bacterium RH1A]
MKVQFLQKIRQTNPLVHNLTNIVAANFSANGLLALGASPIMSACVEEMEEVPALSQAVVINIGTLMGKDLAAMRLAGQTANRLGLPVVLDPVGVGATSFRRATVEALLKDVQFSAIRGNAGELAVLAGADWQAKGVDAGQGSADLASIAQTVARKYQTIAVISGETDWLSDGKQTVSLHNGTPLFPKITASGCLLSAVCGAFLAVAEKGDYLAALIEACTAYAVAGELAAQGLQAYQHSQFMICLLDELAGLTPEAVEALARVNYV